MAFEFFPPVLGKGEYHCPHCNVYAKQLYAHLCTLTTFGWTSVVDAHLKFNENFPPEWVATKCQHCSSIALWNGDNMIYPKITIAAPPNSDLSADVQADYREAASVLAESPRAAAALLRLALQKLCVQLGEKGGNINDDIKSMVGKGLNPLVQKSLDALRITGNNAVHPGEIDLSEEPQRVIKLFDLINFIASKMITEPKEIESFYKDLPPDAIRAVERRDKDLKNS